MLDMDWFLENALFANISIITKFLGRIWAILVFWLSLTEFSKNKPEKIRTTWLNFADLQSEFTW